MSDKTENEDGETIFVRRLREAIRASGKADSFAEISGISRNTLNKYLSGTQATAPALVKIADASGWSIDYLLGRVDQKRSARSGIHDTELLAGVATLLPADARAELARRTAEGTISVGGTLHVPPKPKTGTGSPDLMPVSANSNVLEGFVAIPHLEVKASAGPGLAAAMSDSGQLRQIAFRESWLRSLGITPANAEFVEAQGDSMHPTIQDGDLMLLDRGYGEVINGKIYVLVVGGLVVVKRVSLLAFGGLMLISDNERYTPEPVARDEVNNLNFQARVAWFGRPI